MTEFKDIKAFTFDVDGVFTDGGILCDLAGELYRTFDAKDGFAVRMAVMNGLPVGVITGGRSISIQKRFLTSGVPEADIYLGSRVKSEDFMDFCARHNLEPKDVMYIGDDIPDIETMQLAGLSVCPSDAVEEVKEAADFISPYPGGHGCIRHSLETAMKASGHWIFNSQQYKKLF